MKRSLILIFVFITGTIAFKASCTEAPQLVYICISKGSEKYHSHVCHGFKRCTHERKQVTLNEAVKRGYKPCKICY
ncbi:hypothetical protein AY601_2258 [Pedobacter cryoconitis]|uniref:Uncharacterized protein n=1 Tax=Pedobacter cryoconitis TaxID=188932 RepID=A0A127VCR7_9SPHI|nr:hypothetical protein AY601_2258 [Pedobacter cryoconitis]